MQELIPDIINLVQIQMITDLQRWSTCDIMYDYSLVINEYIQYSYVNRQWHSKFDIAKLVIIKIGFGQIVMLYANKIPQLLSAIITYNDHDIYVKLYDRHYRSCTSFYTLGKAACVDMLVYIAQSEPNSLISLVIKYVNNIGNGDARESKHIEYA